MTVDLTTVVAAIVVVFSAATWWEAYTMRKFFEDNVVLVHLKEGDLK